MVFDFFFWPIIFLILLYIAFKSIYTVAEVLWQIFSSLFHATPIDLKSQFGDWAVITGSTDGIGKAYAKELGHRGLNLVLISRSLEKLEKTRNEILETSPGIKIEIIAVDFSKGREVYSKIEEKLKNIPVGILVNNVGTNYEYPMYLGEVPEDVLWDIINLNVGATTRMTRMVINQMKSRGKGVVVNISSGSEFQPLPLMTVYAATKVYVKSFSEAIRAEYARCGIKVQHLTPLFISTKMNAYSERLQVSSVFVPDATTYARNAIETLGKLNTSTGYWGHGIQVFFMLLGPEWIRIKFGKLMNLSLRKEYFKNNPKESL